MSIVILFALAAFLGLTAIFTAVALGWCEARSSKTEHPSRWLESLTLLLAGLALFVIVQWKAINIYAYIPMSLAFFFEDAGSVVWVAAALVLLTLVAFWRRFTGPIPQKGSILAKCMVATLLVLLIDANVVQYLRASWDSNYVSGVPRVAMTPTGTAEGYKHGYRFRAGTEGYFGDKGILWSTVLADYKGKPELRYLEVGLFEGQSAFWVIDNILTHPTSHLTGIDPFFDTDSDGYALPAGEKYKDVFYSNLSASGAKERATIIEGFSQVELRKLPLNSFDIIYIDGSHAKADVLEDAILSWRLLKEGGVLIFDDYYYTKAAIDIFYSCFGEHFDVLHVADQVLLKKHPQKTWHPK